MKRFKKVIIMIVMFVLVVSAFVFPAKSQGKVNADARVTDLTGTTWIFNKETIDVSESHSWSVYFGTKGFGATFEDWFNYTGMSINRNEFVHGMEVAYSDKYEWFGVETDEEGAYGYINFIGGDDVTNSSLINWLYANAELQVSEAEQTGISADIILPSIFAVTLGTVTVMYLLTFKKRKRI